MLEARERRDRDDKETGRVEAFSDGVFSIAITLLVLELKVPHRAPDGPSVLRALAEQWPSYLAYLTSFATVGIMWLNHHRPFSLINKVDHRLLLYNGLLLLGVSVVPFPTAIVAEYLGQPGARIAGVIYSATYVYIACAFNVLWRYTSSPRRRPVLLSIAHDSAAVRALRAQYRFGPLAYGVATAAAFVDGTLSFVVCSLLAVFFALPPRVP
jgi:uncharacterized membrane protein